MSRYFSLEEFVYSETAVKKGICNIPPFEVVESLSELAEVLDGIREAWGSGIRVTSGYRCPELNKAVGGVPTSAHTKGNAADLQVTNGRQKDFNKFLIAYVAKEKIKFDQILLERSGKTEWTHFGLFSNDWEQRGQILNLEV